MTACEFPRCRNEGKPCPVCGRSFCEAHAGWHFHSAREISLKFGGGK
jgi:hypothetical protein